MEKKVIAVVGPIASGKGALISLLEKNGYHCLSLSDVVRQKAKEWGLPLTRENLQNVGDQLRQKFGGTILAELATQEIKKHPEEKFVVDSVRNPAELLYIKNNFNAFTIGITASAKKRFELMQIRGREWDPKTWEEFEKLEERDRGVGQEDFGQQVEKCLEMADIVVDNNGSFEDFQTNLGYFLAKLVDL